MQTQLTVYKTFPDDVRMQLLARRAELSDRKVRVERDLKRENDALVADFADRAIQTQNDGPLQAIGEAVEDELHRIDLALERLEAGQYGICTECGLRVELERLQAVPYATTCMECARASTP